MEDIKPIKRTRELRFLSHEHHHSLLLCWKIRTGFAKNISMKRIKAYADWFYAAYLENHFNVEERFLFPILGKNNRLIKEALAQHKNLQDLFKKTENLELVLKRIEKELKQHIRFEERVLFNTIQNAASLEQLKGLSRFDTEARFIENTKDEFWL